MIKTGIEKLDGADAVSAGVAFANAASEALNASGVYEVTCTDADGNIVWKDTFKNLVTTVGGNNMLDNHLSGSGYTAAWYLGLIGSTGYTTGVNVADTASSHSGWAEDTNYSQSTRPAASWNSASGKSKSLASGAVFNISGLSGQNTIKGCFLISNGTKGGTSGVLYSAGLFTGGDQPVVNGNILTVTYTASV